MKSTALLKNGLLNWIRKPVYSARSGVQVLQDGRLRCWIEHDTLTGVTPTMLVWWFKHLEGEMDYQGLRIQRYLVWHPLDHQAVRYKRRNSDGSVGVGSVLHIRERLGGNSRFQVNGTSRITKLDETGFEHRVQRFGTSIAKMRYHFEQVDGGTRYTNCLTVGLRGYWGRILNPLISRFIFGPERGRAWIKHNIEEVGNFQGFLPKLYATETNQLEYFAWSQDFEAGRVASKDWVVRPWRLEPLAARTRSTPALLAMPTEVAAGSLP
jgi:hypothetical protein